MKKILSVLSFIMIMNVSIVSIFANTKATAEEYIQRYKGVAILEMKKYGIPASIKLAQGLLESGIGTSKLAVQGNNHFGIKCHTVWTGPSMKHTDDAPNECFRVYSDAKESYMDHSQFLMTRPWYAPLFKLKTNDYKGWAYGLKKAGYATNPRYAEMLIDVIERHQLFVYDMELSEKEMEAYRNRLVDQEKESLIALQNQNVKIKSSPEVNLPVSRPHMGGASNTGVVFYNNKVKVVRLQKGETLSDIGTRYRISGNRLRQYNDLKPKQELSEGQLVYLEPKKNKAKQKKHLVLSHETIWSISQNYGISLEKLYERNLLRKGEEPAAGVSLSLRKKVKTKPALRKLEEQKTPATIKVPGLATNEQESREKPVSIPQKNTGTVQPVIVKKEPGINMNPFTYPPSNSDTAPVTAKFIYHTVQTGDTLFNISKRYDVTVEQIRDWNKMTDNSIQLHQQLIIFQ